MRRPDARILPILVPVTTAGLATLAAALVTQQQAGLGPVEVGGLLLLVGGATLAERFPVPIEIEGMPAGGVSLAAVFIVGAAVLYGWAPAVIVAFLAAAVVHFAQKRPFDRLLYNGAAYALSASPRPTPARMTPALMRGSARLACSGWCAPSSMLAV